MRLCRLLATGVAMIVLAGCGSADESASNAAEEEGVFDDMTGTLERAEEVGDIAAGRKEQLDEEMAE